MAESSQPRKLTVRFYTSASGRGVFREELEALGPEAKAEVVSAIKRRSKGEQFGREDEPVRGNIRAVRSTCQGNEYRALYALVGRHDEVFLGLHAIKKKSAKLPKQAIKLATQRLADWEGRGSRGRPPETSG